MIEFLPHEVEHRLRNKYHEQNPRGIEPTFREWLDQQGIQSAEQGTAVIENERVDRLRKVAANRVVNQIPVRYIGAKLTDPQILEWAEKLPQDELLEPIGDIRPNDDGHYDVTGPSLLILGPTGTGKTHQAHGLVRWLLDRDLQRDIRITSTVDLFAELRPRQQVDAEALFQGYARCDLLLLDDLGVAKTSEWVEETTYRLVNHRYNQELMTVFTSNVPPKELGERLGERVASRLTQMCDQVVLRGEDRRKAKAA